jgi:alkylation response protein AidB-like acyl-CoA dehydrogenase
MIDFEPTEEQRAYCETIVRFAQRELNDAVVARDGVSDFSRDAWEKCGKFGLLGLAVPETYGGSDADGITIALALEALGYGCTDNGLVFSLNAQMWACTAPIVRFGSEAQKKKYLPGLCDGSLIGVQCTTEPDSGSDAFAMSTSAERRGDEYVLNGSKTFVTNAPIADVFLVLARTGASRGLAATSAFLIERDTAGLNIGKPMDKMGLRTSPMSEVSMADCVVPADQMLGTPGSGMAIFNSYLDWERSYIMASSIGTMQRQLERCIEYARQRQQFGQAIGKFQSVANRIVDMKIRLETARLLMYNLAWRRAEKKRTALEGSMVKLYLSECFLQSSLDAIQIHGGLGYMRDAEIERDTRDAVASRIYSGTSEIQRMMIARRLGL